MMDKLAHDAYSQGAYDALQQMDIPDNIKIAAAQHLTKTAGVGKAIGDFILGANRVKGLRGASRLKHLQTDHLANLDLKNIKNVDKDLLQAFRKDQAHALLGGGTAALGTAGALGYAGGMFDEDEPVVVPEPAPAPEPEDLLTRAGNYGSELMDQAGDYGSKFLERAQKGELSTAEIAAIAGTGALGAGGLAYGLS